MSRVYNFSAVRQFCRGSVTGSSRRDVRLSGNRYVRDGDESPGQNRSSRFLIPRADLRELMNIPENYKVLFLQEGASLQFAMIPMNLMKTGQSDFILTGQWSKEGLERGGKVRESKM